MRKLNLLLVEDNDILRQIQTKVFQGYGHEVLAVESAASALTMLRQKTFDLILMDLVMPEMDGFECTKQIKALQIQTPVIALSGNNSDEIQRDCLLAGMSGFLAKPTNQEAFEAIIQQVLEA
ncbi:hypothetical protein THMIRHAM_20380 [Thiomicrorhabdus immobilis]|uniref:Response regulatory domain-containing protein n=1 Tax=Thiomicrorhabdus immobilis TaxID=2791037 RepID=A0ABN6CYT0_9GAMM|nr:response regulator [Thiomicrorhabdus immobilis]BCN94253.1 hypothetical protein THMIRHAM_20380 [Thiomicrorhabdus immobilis]